MERSNNELISLFGFFRPFIWIYQERYTCPSLALHPLEEAFVAQTNGDYMAVFSSQKPYKMNKRRRYDGHKVRNNKGEWEQELWQDRLMINYYFVLIKSQSELLLYF